MIKICCVIGGIALWLFVSFIGFMLSAGPQDPPFVLDENYEMWRWPGLIVRVEIVGEDRMFSDPIGSAARTNAFAVLDKFIVGKTLEGKWFAIDRKTHKTWFPYSSKEELEQAANVSFSESILITSFPRSYLYIHPLVPFGKGLVVIANIFFPSVLILYLIGFRRIGKIFEVPT